MRKKLYMWGFAMLFAWFFIVRSDTRTARARTTQQADMEWTIKAYPIRSQEKLVDIVGLKAAGQVRSFEDSRSVALRAPDDWLQGAAVSVTNTSSRVINSVSIEIRFRAAESKAYTAVLSTVLGSARHLPGIKPNVWIQPSETVDIPIPADERYLKLTEAIASARSSGVSRVAVDFEVLQIVFDGLPDVIWRKGSWFRRDPSDPRGFYRVDSISRIGSKGARTKLLSAIKPAATSLSRSAAFGFLVGAKPIPKKAVDFCREIGYVHFSPCVQTEGCDCYLEDEQAAYSSGIYSFSWYWDYCKCGDPMYGGICLQWDPRMTAMYDPSCDPGN